MSGVNHPGLDVLHRKLDLLLDRTGPSQRFMSIRTAAAYSDLSQDSIRRLLERGDLTAHRPVRGRVLIDRQELDGVILGATARPRKGRGIRRNGDAATAGGHKTGIGFMPDTDDATSNVRAGKAGKRPRDTDGNAAADGGEIRNGHIAGTGIVADSTADDAAAGAGEGTPP
ncbi:MAG: excisionase family DNA-binding protein [Planctomycetota bacterium]|jgi:excisionase family DNA binding protein